ncbi:MAG TPA: GNAT family N-acetyltransferase [Phycisphaerae bacterium]|nr:GNAT family N-acetyltransferase [Phycisphaerae bacterium]HUT58844.1 GNAT family N-acetyltransferase [Phycisphaerae bacterium]
MIAQTTSLILRRLRQEDAAALHPIFSDTEATRFALYTHDTVAQTAEWVNAVRRGYEKHGFGPWCIVRKSDDAVIGYCGCGIIDVDGKTEYEIGYRVLPCYWGQGFATEAARATLDHASRNLGFSRIVAVIQPANVASVRVAEKAGMKYERDTMFKGVLVRVYAIHGSSAG